LLILIYVGVAADQGATFVDFGVEAADPTGRALDLLADHLSCDHIEVWRGDLCIAVVRREPGART